MSVASRLLTLGATLAFLSPLVAADARQMDVTDRPAVSGPLELLKRNCQKKRELSHGQVAVVAKSCVRFYALDAAAEDDAARDYGVIWLHTNIDGRHGWCATEVRSDIDLPPRTLLHNHKPKTFRTPERRPFTSKMFVDADEHATTRASIMRRFVFFPRIMKARLVSRGHVFRILWKGSKDRKLAFASGVEISWRVSDGPPKFLSSKLRYVVRKKSVC